MSKIVRNKNSNKNKEFVKEKFSADEKFKEATNILVFTITLVLTISIIAYESYNAGFEKANEGLETTATVSEYVSE